MVKQWVTLPLLEFSSYKIIMYYLLCKHVQSDKLILFSHRRSLFSELNELLSMIVNNQNQQMSFSHLRGYAF